MSKASNMIAAVARKMAEGHYESAVVTLTRAVSEIPDNPTLFLLLGSVLEKVGRDQEAFRHYFSAVTLSHLAGLWTSEATTPPSLKGLIHHAEKVIASRKTGVLNDVLAMLREKYGTEALRRVEKAISFYLGEFDRNYPDERQRPVFLFFPDISVRPYYDTRSLKWVRHLEAYTDSIREEALAVLSNSTAVEGFTAGDKTPVVKIIPKWDAYFFFRYGEPFASHHLECPVTSAALSLAPLCVVPRYAPETLFSILRGGGSIPPHRGVSNTRLVAHLPLVVPPSCGLEVGGGIHVWKKGEIVLFDDTFVHSAYNNSEEVRIVLLMDVWHPELSLVERYAVTDIITTLQSFGE